MGRSIPLETSVAWHRPDSVATQALSTEGGPVQGPRSRLSCIAREQCVRAVEHFCMLELPFSSVPVGDANKAKNLGSFTTDRGRRQHESLDVGCPASTRA